ARPVAELGGNDQGPCAADLHAGDALIPAADDPSRAEAERKRFAPIARAVELLAMPIRRLGVVQPAGIVDRHVVAGRGGCAAADRRIRDLEARDVVHGRRIVLHDGSTTSTSLPMWLLASITR